FLMSADGWASIPERKRATGSAAIPPREQLSWPMAIVVASIVVFFAGFINWYYFDMLVAHHAMRSWQEVPAKILKDQLRTEHGSRGGTTRRATAQYTYEFGGQSYTGHRVTWDGGSDNMGSSQYNAFNELESHRRSGRPFRCFVNPEHPEQSILYRQLRPEILVLFSALELWLGLPLVMAIVRWLWSVGPKGLPLKSALALDATDAPTAEPWRGGAVRTTLFALAYNLLTIPLFMDLPEAAKGTFWPWVFAALLIGVGWVSVWLAVTEWRPPARRSPLEILPRSR
ncbi:MAG TPA: DUF3592 domain-containing protein, partial [Pirellulales bacterium]|nr:DUF3592 domain-containing protein [Pirellulales bacterium]